MVRRLCPLFAALLLASPRARAQEPYTKDWGVRGEHAVGEMQGLDVGGVPADLYCATSDRSITPLVVVVGEIGSSRSAARAFARHLASHGMPVLVPAQDHPDPGENARRVARAQAAARGLRPFCSATSPRACAATSAPSTARRIAGSTRSRSVAGCRTSTASRVTSAFFGHRQLNDISAFDAASGFRLEARADFDGDGERAVWLGYQLDLTAVAAMAAFGASL